MVSMKTNIKFKILRRFKNHREKCLFATTVISKTVQNRHGKGVITVFEPLL